LAKDRHYAYKASNLSGAMEAGFGHKHLISAIELLDTPAA